MTQSITSNTVFMTQHGPLTNICVFLCDTRLSRVSKAFRRANEHAMKQVEARLEIRIETPQLLESSEHLEQDLINWTQTLLTRDSLAERMRGIVSGQNLPRLRALHINQREDASAMPEFAQMQREERYSFSVERFMRAEELASHGTTKKDIALCELWRDDLKRSVHFAGPGADASADVIRAWMNNPANADILARIEEFNHLGYMPPEIQYLTGLKRLVWSGTDNLHLAELPGWFENFQCLEHLELNDHGFSEIPGVLERLSALQDLNVRGNRFPIRVLPEWLIDRFNFVDRFLDGLLGYDLVSRTEFRLGFRGSQLTDVPFRLWFRETVRIPNIPVLFVGLVFTAIGVRTIGNGNSLQSVLDNICISLVAFFVCSPLLIPFLLVGLVWEFINISLNYLFEPIVTCVRDQLGYSRMVHIRDLPVLENELT